MPSTMTIQTRRGTAAAWTSANPVLAAGERGFETDTRYSKMGDGTTAWTSLAYEAVSGGGGGGGDASTNTASSIDSEVALFSSTSGKLLKRATLTAPVVKSASGLLSAATPGTDYVAPGGSGAALTGITNSQVGTLVADLAAKAPLASPTFTGAPQIPNGSVGTPGLAFVGETNTGIYRPGGGMYALTVLGANVWSIDNNGAMIVAGTSALTGAVTVGGASNAAPTFRFNRSGTNEWTYYQSGSNQLLLRDEVNARSMVAYSPGASSAAALAAFSSRMTVADTLAVTGAVTGASFAGSGAGLTGLPGPGYFSVAKWGTD